MAQYSALRCVSGIWQNNEKPLISNGLRFVVTCLLTAALWVLFHLARHSWATIARDLSIPPSVISRRQSYDNDVNTQIYLATESDDEVDVANKRSYRN